MNLAIETINLTKSYGKARGIIDVNMKVEQGEIFGFIGPNGAGKSTTIRTLLGLLYKTSGEAYIFGKDIEKEHVEILKDVGYLPSEVFYYDNMKAIDLLHYSAGFYQKDCSKKIKELSDALEVELDRKIEDMSMGNKKKVGIIQGLLHSPKLIILDEPTAGLDPLMQRTFFELIKKENHKGATVLFSSHILGEVQKICDRVGIIKEGKLIQTQKISELQEKSYKKVKFTTKEMIHHFKMDGATNVQNVNGTVSFFYRGDCNSLLQEVQKYRLTNIDIEEPELEEIFMHYYVGETEEKFS